MKIAIVGSIWISIPPPGFGFGAQEYLIYYLAESLQRRGHEVTLFATANAAVDFKIVSVSEKQVKDIPFPDTKIKDIFELINVGQAYKQAGEFDIIHNHLLPYGLPFVPLTKTPTVHTLHHLIYKNRADIFLYQRYHEQAFVSISNNQRHNLPELNYSATVYNGIDAALYEFQAASHGGYLLYIGRMKKYKGIHTAIQVAKKLQLPLRIVSPLPSPTQSDYEEVITYWNTEVKPHIDNQLITHTDLITGKEKVKLYQNAKLLIFPVEREEPFGMTLIEAMSCGTPVVAYANGAIPEIVSDKQHGFLINQTSEQAKTDFAIPEPGVEGLCQAVQQLYTMPDETYKTMRSNCRKQVEAHFTIERMVDNYEAVYEQILSK